MKECIKILSLLIFITLYSCSSFYYGKGQLQKQDSNSQTLFMVNGTGKDLKWYSKNYFSNLPNNNGFGYTWFIEGATNSRSFNTNLDSILFIGVNYNNPTDTIFNSTYSRQDLNIKGWKIVIGDQDYEKKLVLLKWPDTLDITTLSFSIPFIEPEICYYYNYSTNQENIDYLKFYNSQDEILAEGPVTPDYLVKQKKPKRKYREERIGIWKIYINSNTTKIDTIKYNGCENLIYVDRIE